MKKTNIISFFATLSLIIGLTLPILAATATGTKPDTIKNSVDLLYYIRFYGGGGTLNGNKVTLTKDMNNIPDYMYLYSDEDLVLDLNGHHMMFVNSSMYSIWNNSKGNITITDSSNTDDDFIRSTNASTGSNITTTIYNGSTGNLTIENTSIICNSQTEDAISAYQSGTIKVKNCSIQGDRGCALLQANSTIEFNNVTFRLGNITCRYGVKLAGGNTVAKLNNVTSTSVVADSPTVLSDSETAYTVIDGGTYTTKRNTLKINKGQLIIKNGSFESKEDTSVHVANGNIEVYDALIKGNIYGLTVSENVKAILSSGKYIGTNRAGIGLPNNSFNSVLDTERFVTDESLSFDNQTRYYNSANEVQIYGYPVEIPTIFLTYNGKNQIPNVRVIDANGKSLLQNVHFTLSCPTAKKIGTYTAKVKFIGIYSRFGSKNATFHIIPKGTSISKLKAGKKQVTVYVKKNTTQTTSYQIMYSTSSKFKGGKIITISNKTTSKTIKKLKAKKKYYFKVRTLKKVGSKAYASTWSSVKSIKTK